MSEAQRVISVSLGKIAHSRVQRGGCSLHKSLMLATILHKARNVFMEEAFMLHYRATPTCIAAVTPPQAKTDEVIDDKDYEADNDDKEDQDERTYLDLDCCQVESERLAQPENVYENSANGNFCSKRKRVISEEETEEAVASILPKRQRRDDGDSDPEQDSDDSCYESGDSDDNDSESMDVDRITSLVSIFSFNNSNNSHLHRSASSPDLCSWEVNRDLSSADSGVTVSV